MLISTRLFSGICFELLIRLYRYDSKNADMEANRGVIKSVLKLHDGHCGHPAAHDQLAPGRHTYSPHLHCVTPLSFITLCKIIKTGAEA